MILRAARIGDAGWSSDDSNARGGADGSQGRSGVAADLAMAADDGGAQHQEGSCTPVRFPACGEGLIGRLRFSSDGTMKRERPTGGPNETIAQVG